MKVCLACAERFESELWVCPGCRWFPKAYPGYLAFALDQIGTADSFDEAFFAQLAAIEPKNFWFRARNRLLIWALHAYFPDAKNLLEIGCGTGFVLSGLRREFPDLVLSGSDIFSESLAFAHARVPDATFFQMDARHIPFDQNFDIIGAFDVLEHIGEDERVLGQICQALKPGGGLILTVPQHPFLWSYFDDLSHHQRRYTRPELLGKLERGGFRVSYVSSFVSFLLPLMLLSRLRQRRPVQGHWDLTAEFKTGWLWNKPLESVLACERLLIEQGFSLPMGGSLLVIASRSACPGSCL